jgi:prepilin signal peptidase PulO-like enzyme (type II secretory pathway)
MSETIFFIISLIISISFFIQTYLDLKYKEINGRLAFWTFMLAFIAGFYFNSWTAILIFFLAFAGSWLLHKIKAWEGGDVKIFIAGAVFLSAQNAGLFVANIAFYGLLWIIPFLIRKKGNEIPFIPVIALAWFHSMLGINLIF